MQRVRMNLVLVGIGLLCVATAVTGCTVAGNGPAGNVAIIPLDDHAATSTPLAGILQPSPRPTDWRDARDGQLAFVSDRRQREVLDLWLFDLASNRAEPLTSDDHQNLKPAWSPDGQVLGYLSLNPSALRAVVFPDRAIQTIVGAEPHVEIQDFTWSPDGRALYYATFNEQSYENALWQVDVQTHTRERISSGSPPLSVSADGRYLAFLDRNPDPQTRFDPMVLRILRLSDRQDLSVKHSGTTLELAWSPTADLLAVTAEAVSIYAVEREQVIMRTAESLTSGPGAPKIACNPSWSPDGHQLIAVLSSIGNVCQGELLLRSDDGRVAGWGDYALGGLMGYARWSRDSQWIAYSRNDTLNVEHLRHQVLYLLEGQIWIIDSSGELARPLIRDCGYNGQPAWRP